MKITEIVLSLFEVPANTARFDLVEQVTPAKQRWTVTAPPCNRPVAR